MNARIHQLNIAPHGGVPKMPIDAAVLTRVGIIGDAQAHPQFHGGAERAVCLYALAHIEALQREGHPIYPGSVGENLTIAGLDWNVMQPGVRLTIGDKVVVEISSYTVPCRTIAGSFLAGEYKLIAQTTHPGESRVYARVLRGGRLAVGQEIRVLDGDETFESDMESFNGRMA